MRLASRVAVNRTVAGVHFPIDSVAGCILGFCLGDYLVRRCKVDPSDNRQWTFDGEAFASESETHDFEWAKLEHAMSDASAAAPGLSGAAADAPAPAPILAGLWAAAVAEWK